MFRRLKLEKLIAAVYHQQIRQVPGPTFDKGDLRTEEGNVLPPPKYGGINTVVVLTGNSIIGKQGAQYISAMLESTRMPVGLERVTSDNADEYFNAVKRNRVAVHVDLAHDAAEKKKTLKICKDLGLNVFMTRMRTFPGFCCRFPDVDIQLVCQNYIGNYGELEYAPVPGVVEALRVVTAKSNTEYLNFAFNTVRKLKRKRVVLVNMESEWPVTDGSLVEIALELQQKDYSDIELELMDMDCCVSRLIIEPNYFDVIFSNDRYASFLATICSGVCGGASLFSSIEIGGHHAIFKPLQTKLSLTNYKDLSPYGIVSTCVDLLNHLELNQCGQELWNQMMRTMEEGIKTKEFGGKDNGEYVICNIMNKLRCLMFELN